MAICDVHPFSLALETGSRTVSRYWSSVYVAHPVYSTRVNINRLSRLQTLAAAAAGDAFNKDKRYNQLITYSGDIRTVVDGCRVKCNLPHGMVPRRHGNARCTASYHAEIFIIATVTPSSIPLHSLSRSGPLPFHSAAVRAAMNKEVELFCPLEYVQTVRIVGLCTSSKTTPPRYR